MGATSAKGMSMGGPKEAPEGGAGSGNSPATGGQLRLVECMGVTARFQQRLVDLRNAYARIGGALPDGLWLTWDEAQALMGALMVQPVPERPWMDGDPRPCGLCGRDGTWHAHGNNNVSGCRGYSPAEGGGDG